MRICYDSTNPNDIPTSARMVGYYCDGIYAVSESVVRNRFPQAVLVPISAVGTNAGIVGDVEPGCMTPSYAVGWVKMRRAASVDPTIYCNQLNSWAGVRQAFRAAGVAEPYWWVANYDRIQVIPPGAIAKQFTNPTYSGGHYDLSVVADFWPGIDSAPPSGIGHGGAPGLLGGFLLGLDDSQQTRLYNLINGVPGDPAVPGMAHQLQSIFDQMVSPTYKTLDARLQAVLDAVHAFTVGAGGGLTPEQASVLTGISADIAAIRMRVEKDLAS